jgi:hypothetical protein
VAGYGSDFFPVLEAQLAQQDYYAHHDNITAAGSTVPGTLQEAMNSPQREQWLAALQAELDQLAARETCSLESPREGVKIIPAMWVYALKTLPDRKIYRYKAWLDVKGNYLKEKVQFSDNWAPTGRSAILRCLFAMDAKFGWEIWSFDISGAYLNAKLKTAVYVGQPPGFDDGSDQVWCLNID